MRKLFFSLFLVMTTGILSSQSSEMIKVIKKNGEEVDMFFTLRRNSGNLIFPDDNKDFIKGKRMNEKIKIPKSEIDKIQLAGGIEYLVMLDEYSKEYFIGYYLSRGKLDIFKCYTYDHLNVNNSFQSPYGGASIGVSVGFQQKTINKVAIEAYYIIENREFKSFDPKKLFKSLEENDPKFKDYLDDRGSIKKSEYDEVLSELTDHITPLKS